MSMSATSTSRPRRTRRLLVSLGTLVVGIVLGFLLISVFAHVAQTGLWSRVAGYVTGRSTSIDVSSPAVVEKIRQLSRLETVVYSLDKIVEGSRQYPYLPDFLVGDKLLLIAHGEVIAGVDLSQLNSGDVSVKGDAVRVRLPAPQVLTTRIDNGRTKVYSRTTGLLVNADENLESQVRLAAEQQITQAALSDGILDKARQNARTSVTALLYGLGFHTVDVQ
jgi:predicted transcriptional regulator